MSTLRLVPFVVCAALFGGCQSCGQTIEDTPDAGSNNVISCSDASTCPAEQPECAFGICQRPCADSAACAAVPGTFCNVASGFCEPGCTTDADCSGGLSCAGGQCLSTTGCTDKCDCQPGQVCTTGTCATPPASCSGPADCGRGQGDACDAFLCNGFTHQCFDPDPQPCTDAADCVGRPGCADGCVCTGNQDCVPSVACTVENEATTCGLGFFCDGNGSCAVLPNCTGEADCTPSGLSCNTGTGKCERSLSCTTSADCTLPPQTFCDPANSRCAVPTCVNGGRTCNANETCQQTDGRCVPQGTGSPCSSDSTCPSDQYCAFVNGAGNCAPGCRNNASCTGGQTCNGAHQCTGGGGGAGLNETCADDADCASGLACNNGAFGDSTCQEPCNPTCTQDCPTAGCCTLTAHALCNAAGFCAELSLFCGF